MEKHKIQIERELHCRSSNIIWSLLSTAEGLEKWLADSVQRNGKVLNFRWGELWQSHEVRTATIIKEAKDKYIRFRWDEDADEDADVYCEFKIEKSDITNDYILTITDYADEDDVDTITDLWENNLEQLHRSTGL